MSNTERAALWIPLFRDPFAVFVASQHGKIAHGRMRQSDNHPIIGRDFELDVDPVPETKWRQLLPALANPARIGERMVSIGFRLLDALACMKLKLTEIETEHGPALRQTDHGTKQLTESNPIVVREVSDELGRMRTIRLHEMGDSVSYDRTWMAFIRRTELREHVFTYPRIGLRLVELAALEVEFSTFIIDDANGDEIDDLAVVDELGVEIVVVHGCALESQSVRHLSSQKIFPNSGMGLLHMRQCSQAGGAGVPSERSAVVPFAAPRSAVLGRSSS